MKRKLRICSFMLIALGAMVLFIYTTGCGKKCCTIGFVLSTDTVSAITETTAECGGTIASDDEDTVTAKGVCWSTRQSPTVEDDTTSDGLGKGHFISSIHKLTPHTRYWVRAYVTNRKGSAYGNEQTFSTLVSPVLPTLTTTQITNVTQTTATSGGTITSAGISPVTERGVCWSTSQYPTTVDSKTSDGSGAGPFVSNLTSLIAGTTYYLRAYATNSAGTAYGNQVSCTTAANVLPCPGMPTFTYGGKVYNTIQIGTQCWMKENLNIGTRIDGPSEQTDNNTIEKYCYDNLTTNCDIYGGLYQWGEMVQYLNGASDTSSWNPVPGTNVQGICPTGWHLPTNVEYSTLITYLGGVGIAGGKMKETGVAHWFTPNKDATNESGFTALPGGFRGGTGNFGVLGRHARLWKLSEFDPGNAWYDRLTYDTGYVAEPYCPKTIGLSVRCIKN